MSKTVQPSELELQVLAMLWREGPQTVRQVRENLPDGKDRAYTTVLTVLQVMEKKGLVDHGKVGNVHLYRPLVTRQQVLGPMFRTMVRNVFGGRPAEAMAHLIEDQSFSEEELVEVRRLLNAKTTTRHKQDEEQ